MEGHKESDSDLEVANSEIQDVLDSSTYSSGTSELEMQHAHDRVSITQKCAKHQRDDQVKNMDVSSELGSTSSMNKSRTAEDLSTENDELQSSAEVDAYDSSDGNSPIKAPKRPKPKLRRTSSSLPLRLVSLPKVNCREKIILCIDHSDEMFRNKFASHSSGINPVFVTLASAVRQFVNTKSFLNKNNQFSLILLNEEAQFITDLNQNPDELMMMLNDIAGMSSSHDYEHTDVDKIFDLSAMFDMVLEQSGLHNSPKQFLRVAPQFIVRVVFVYGRSDTRLVFSSERKSFNTLIKYPQFFLDCVYIHKPLHECKFVENIFSSICELDVGGTSHIYECGTDSNMACVYNVFAKLLAHPLQRPQQREIPIEYELKRDPLE